MVARSYGPSPRRVMECAQFYRPCAIRHQGDAKRPSSPRRFVCGHVTISRCPLFHTATIEGI